MLTSFKQSINKGFITPIVLVSMMTLFLFIAYNAPKIYGLYKNSHGVEDTVEDTNLEMVQGYLRTMIDNREVSNKDDIIDIFNNKDINLKFKEFKMFYDKNKKYFIKKGIDDNVLILDFDFDIKSKRFKFIPIGKGEIYDDV